MDKYKPTKIEEEAISLLEKEVAAWQTEEVQVTDDVSFSMRERIKQARKNYWGVFKEPYDPNGNEKMWLHITNNFTELFVRNSDIDTKDINIKAKKADNYGIAAITRFVVRHFLDLLGYGEIMNDFIRRLFIDGTAVQKNIEGFGDQIIQSTNVDLLNIIIDPTAESIQKDGLIERHVMSIDEFEAMPWDNKEWVKGRTDVKMYYDMSKKTTGKVPEVVVYERWRKIPRYFITGDKKDTDWIEGVIIASGVETGQTIIHRIMANPLGRKPYEEAWCIKVPGRWFGVGIPELLFDIQEVANTNYNLIINNSKILQNKLFKTRIGSGVTQQMLSRLSDGGVIPLKNMTDLEEFAISDNRAGGFTLEDRLYNWARRITGGFTFPGAGEPLPASTTATIGLLQQQAARTSFDMVMEGLGMTLERIIKNHWLPIIFKRIDEEEILRITGDADELETLIEDWVKQRTNQEILRFVKTEARIPNDDEIEVLKEIHRQEMKRFGNDLFLKIKKDLFNFDYDVQVVITGEKFDKITMMSQLRQILVELSQIPGLNLDLGLLAKEMLDFMGFGGKRFFKEERPSLPTAAPARAPTRAPTRALRRAPQLPIERTMERAEAIGARL